MTRDSRTLFQRLSQKMSSDFEVSAHIHHAASKGTARENVLKEFLEKGRLPLKYGIGSGEVIGHVRDVSPQCDLIIYDKIDGVALLTDPDVQIYPIESVYGIIEVKSSLSKAELREGLEKIRSVKSMMPFGAIVKSIGQGLKMSHPRPRPFGAIFAYGLAGNSLDSLLENLREWEKDNPQEFWPNYVCILETGVLYHLGKPFEEHLTNDSMNAETWPTSFPWKKDSLFKFYITLLDLCSSTALGPVELARYFNPGSKIGQYFVEGNVEFTAFKTGKKVRLSEVALDKIVAWGDEHGSIKYGEYLIKRFGKLPLGMEGSARLNADVYVYFPGEDKTLKEVEMKAASLPEAGSGDMDMQEVLTLLGRLSLYELAINGRLYAISFNEMSDRDFDELPEV